MRRILFLFLLFFFTCVFITNTNAQKLVIYAATSRTFGSTGSRSATTATCATTATTQSIFNCQFTPALLTYFFTGYVSQFPSTYGFSSSEPIYTPSGSQLASSWTTAFSGGGLLNSLQSQGLCSTTFTTGSTTSGTLGTNCNDYSSTSFGGSVGSCTSSSSSWFSTTTSACSTSSPFLCLCVKFDPTLSPTTRSPTTSSPTKNPTTIAPTTQSPTNNPSKNPTSKPTQSPTKFPLVAETSYPIAYMILSGTLVQSYRTIGNISYDAWQDTTSPINSTIELLDGAKAWPIIWSNVTYRYVDPTTFVTEQGTLEYCNPIPNTVQGSTPMGTDGLIVCPTIYPCVLTDDCTDNLSPSGPGWPDLRACICSKEILIRSDTDPVQGVLNVTMIKLEATTVEDDSLLQSVPAALAVIRCNSFIDRTLNCQFPFLVNAYIPQCQEEPIGCYSGTLGYAFGAFWNSNPRFRYDIPRANWTLDHYKGIASVMNNRLYYSPVTEKPIDPFTSKTWNEYNWLNISDINTTSELIQGQRLSIYQSDIIQAQDYNWVSGVNPPPFTENAGSNPVSLTECRADIAISDTEACKSFTWNSLQSRQYRQPGYTELIPVTNEQFIYSLEFSTNSNFTSIEVLNVNGESCGRVMRPVPGKVMSFVCLGSPGNIASTGFISIVYTGASILMDLPGMLLDESIKEKVDPLSGSLDLFPWSEQSTINLRYAEFYKTGEIYEDEHKFPQRRPPNINITSTTYRLNYTQDDGIREATTAWDKLSLEILQNNLYPWNSALAARSLLNKYTEIPTDLTSSVHLDWLYRQWANSLAPRQCSEDTQCQTFGLGTCKYGPIGPKNYWRSGNLAPDYEIPPGSDEGGCECFSSFTGGGFFKKELFCSTCEVGYGPDTMEQWSRIQQYNSIVSPVYRPNTYPFDISSPTPDIFEAEIACKFPVSKDPVSASFIDMNLCSGRGIVDVYETDEEVEIELLNEDGYLRTPKCLFLIVDDEDYELFPPTSINNLQYVGLSGDILSIINESVYFSGQLCSIEVTSEKTDFIALLSCGEIVSEMVCVNNVLFGREDISFDQGSFKVFNQFSMYLKYN